MIKARLTPDDKWIVVDCSEKIERRQLELSMSKKINNWFIIKKKCPYANVNESFMNKYGMIPVGLWMELIKICQKYNLSIEFQEDFNCKIINCNLTNVDFI